MANVTWKIARRGNAQLPLVIVVALAVVLVLLGKAQSDLFDRARMRLSDWMQPVLAAVNAPAVGFTHWLGSTGELFQVYRENIALKEENARLRQWRNRAVVMEGRAQRYQALLHAVPDPATNSVLARVIGHANRPFLESIVLNAGEGQGVKPGEAVVDPRGLVGRIYLAGQRTSWVILLTDLNSRVPVMVSGGRKDGGDVQAMLVGDNSAMPMLDTLSMTVTLHDGDQVVSSGDGGLLPPGLPIGTLVAQNGGWRVALLADPGSSEDVEVLAFRQPPETPPPLAGAQLPAVAAGLPPAPPPAAPIATPAPPALKVAPPKPAPATAPAGNGNE